jgi:outer membrane immunogenic protein
MQKTLTATTLAAVLAMSGGAYAADLLTGGSMKDGALFAPANTWTGFYIGTNAGGAWAGSNGSIAATADDGGHLKSNSSALSPSGDFGGVELGYNIQRGNIVFGLEGDIQYGDVHDRNSAGAQKWDSVASATGESNLDWFGTIRARVGYAFGRTLVYGTGGFAFGGVRDGMAITSVDGGGGHSQTIGASSSGTAAGYTVGAGVGYALSPAWSVKTEYQYIDLGSTTLSQGASAGGDDWASATLKDNHDYHTIRMSLDYHLSSPIEPLK